MVNKSQIQNLPSDIAAWDGRSKIDIEAIYENHSHFPDFLATLVKLVRLPECESGATWLIKHGLDLKQFQLDAAQSKKLLESAPSLQSWDAKLHVLQCLERLVIAPNVVPQTETFVRTCLSHEKNFVRAWAYGGFHELARQHPQFQQEALNILNEAEKMETAGSVLSRVRRKLKQGF